MEGHQTDQKDENEHPHRVPGWRFATKRHCFDRAVKDLRWNQLTRYTATGPSMVRMTAFFGYGGACESARVRNRASSHRAGSIGSRIGRGGGTIPIFPDECRMRSDAVAGAGTAPKLENQPLNIPHSFQFIALYAFGVLFARICCFPSHPLREIFRPNLTKCNNFLEYFYKLKTVYLITYHNIQVIPFEKQKLYCVKKV